jgi:hypothetical protein
MTRRAAMSRFDKPSATKAATSRSRFVKATSEGRVASGFEAARVPYWEPCPPSVQGRRSAARLLRAGADQFAV